jgi:hypothetical protein
MAMAACVVAGVAVTACEQRERNRAVRAELSILRQLVSQDG